MLSNKRSPQPARWRWGLWRLIRDGLKYNTGAADACCMLPNATRIRTLANGELIKVLWLGNIHKSDKATIACFPLYWLKILANIYEEGI